MPTYDYQCEACGTTREVFHGISAPGPESCESCGAERRMRRLISPGGGVVFKGSGFYATDYRRASNGNGSKTESKTDAKTDTKPAAAPGSCGSGCGCHS